MIFGPLEPVKMNRPPRAKQTVCAIIPAFQEQTTISDVIRATREFVAAVIVVDDGSRDRTSFEAETAGAMVLRHDHNRGKGVALDTGFTYAHKRGFHLSITLDADGQHNPADIPRFVDAYVRTGIPVLIGNRMPHSGNMPFLRRLTNRLMSSYLSKRMGQYVPDTQCGFRLYRTDVIPFVAALATGYAAESEILLRVAARGIRIDSVQIQLVKSCGRSMVHPVRDGARFIWMLWHYRRHNRRRLAASRKTSTFP